MGHVVVVDGRVLRRDTQKGVHGLTVEVWDESCCDQDCLGSTLTNRDGSYSIRFCPSPHAVCPARVFVRVRDREGRLIHDGRRASCACLPNAPVSINVALAPETLWWHHAEPVSWDAPAGPLIDPRVRADVLEALEAFAPTASASIVDCIVPPLGQFGGVLQDAWATLQGDLAAAARFRDVLTAACAVTGCECGEASLADAVERVFAVECPPEPSCGEPAPEEPHGSGCDCGCGDCEGCEAEDPSCPCRPRLVKHDDVAVLVMAAMHVSCGHLDAAKRFTVTILDQVCRLELLGALHRAAASALCGDRRSAEHFRELVELATTTCGDPGRCCSRTSPVCCCETCIDTALERCLRDAVCAWRRIECYSIDSIEPPRACPGETIVVCGRGFGDTPGTVTFREYGTIQDGPRGTVEAWCCNSFTVVVPQRAGCGMTLRLPARTVEICGRFLEFRPFGCVDAEFEGTAPDILQFSVAGHHEGECVEPGTPLRVSWKVCAADRVRVQAVNVATGAVLDALDPAPDRGHWTFDGSSITTTTEVRLEVVATGQCRPSEVSRQLTVVFQAMPNLSVHGIEVTQAIQHYRAAEHLTDPADRGPDNSLRLVTDKTAWVRTYLRSGQVPTFDGGQLADISGILRVERRVGGVWNLVASLAPQNGPVTAEDSFVSYDAERGNIDSTLNFVVPAALMTGLLRFTVEVASPHATCQGNTAGASVTCDVNLRQTLNAAFITIGYDGPNATNTGNLTLPAPTLADCQAETAWAMLTYPVSGAANVRIAAMFTTNTPLDDPRSCPGCCSPNWGALLPLVENLVTADQVLNPGPSAYYGLIASGIPVNVPGCSGVATGGLAGQPATYAHEIGHQFGLDHARCGNAGAGNAAYPVYEPYDLPVDVPANPINTTVWTMASIGEYGLDINTGDIANPNYAEDFMSYCGPRWISRFTHNYLVNDARLTPQVIPTGSGAGSGRVIRDTSPSFERPRGDVEPLIYLVGLIEGDGEVTVSSVARLDARYVIGDGRRSGYRAQLLDADGTVLAEDHVYRYSVTGGCEGAEPCCADCDDRDECGHRPSSLFKALLDDVGPGQCLRIVRCGETVWERVRPDSAPTVSRVRGELDEHGDLRITWSATCGTDAEEAWIRWSTDGTDWRALTVVGQGRHATIPAEQLPSGTIHVQVLVHDGFSTVDAASEAIELPARPPAVTILYPTEGAVIYAERQLHLWGTASDLNGTPLTDDAYAWEIDGEAVGRGADIWVSNPGPGRHTVWLSVSTQYGTGRAESTIEVPGPETAG